MEWGSRWPFFFFCACAGQGEKKNPKKTENVEGRPHFSFFFCGGLNPYRKMSRERERERDRDCWLQLIDGNEGLAGLFFFFSVLAQGRAKKKPKEDRKCGRSTALFFFFVAVLTRTEKMSRERERDRDCWLQLIDGNEGLAGLFFFFSCACAGQGEKKNPKKTENVEGRPQLFFFFLWRS